MTNSEQFDRRQRENAADRRAAIARWAAYVRSHDDDEWSAQQNTLIDAQLQSANEMARSGATDPVAFAEAVDERRTEE